MSAALSLSSVDYLRIVSLAQSIDQYGRPLPQPTRIPPGSAKVAILIARHRAKQSLWHPADAELQPNSPIQNVYERRKNGSDVCIGVRINSGK